MSFNTAASFVTNTNWQAYSGESTLSYLTQVLGLTVQNFVSAATGIAVLFALIRGFIKVKADGLGSFWVDITRIVIHILIPLNLVISLCLVGGGVIQNLKGAETVSLVEPIAVSADGEILENAEIDLDTNTVTVDGKKIEDAEIVTEQFVPMGPAASQVAIKQTGTNGGGYMGVNSAHPLENPNAFTNLIEMLSILLIPAALCFTFGKAVKNKKQGVAIFMAMFICLVLALGTIAVSEQVATPQLAQDGVNISMTDQAGGNMEGKYGCELLGQQYTDNGHMWGRIMNIDVSTYKDENGKTLMYAAPSNLSPASEEYEALVKERVEKLREANPDMDETAIPVDLVTCSGSGLDPHISPAAAEYQVARIAKTNDMTEDEVREIVKKCTDGKFLGLFGEETVNVLKVNLMLDGIL